MCFKVTTSIPTCPLRWRDLMALLQTHPSCLCSAAQLSIPQALHTQLCCSWAFLELNPFCASPHMYCGHDYETWSLQSCAHILMLLFASPPLPSDPLCFSLTTCLFTDICPPPLFAVRTPWGMSHQLCWAFHQVCTTVWALKALHWLLLWDEYCVSV